MNYDFAKGRKEAKAMNMDELRYVANDAKAAAEALKGVEGHGACKGENYYMDEYFTIIDEIRNRKNKV